MRIFAVNWHIRNKMTFTHRNTRGNVLEQNVILKVEEKANVAEPSLSSILSTYSTLLHQSYVRDRRLTNVV